MPINSYVIQPVALARMTSKLSNLWRVASPERMTVTIPSNPILMPLSKKVFALHVDMIPKQANSMTRRLGALMIQGVIHLMF